MCYNTIAIFRAETAPREKNAKNKEKEKLVWQKRNL